MLANSRFWNCLNHLFEGLGNLFQFGFRHLNEPSEIARSRCAGASHRLRTIWVAEAGRFLAQGFLCSLSLWQHPRSAEPGRIRPALITQACLANHSWSISQVGQRVRSEEHWSASKAVAIRFHARRDRAPGLSAFDHNDPHLRRSYLQLLGRQLESFMPELVAGIHVLTASRQARRGCTATRACPSCVLGPKPQTSGLRRSQISLRGLRKADRCARP
jgi:hypothetical protein